MFYYRNYNIELLEGCGASTPTQALLSIIYLESEINFFFLEKFTARTEREEVIFSLDSTESTSILCNHGSCTCWKLVSYYSVMGEVSLWMRRCLQRATLTLGSSAGGDFGRE